MHDFRKLRVWQRSHRLTLRIYEVTKAFPEDERFGLTSQMRRSAVSVESNLAEGSGRSGDRDFARFVALASGSASELECQVLIASDLGLIADGEARSFLSELVGVREMLKALRRSLVAGA